MSNYITGDDVLQDVHPVTKKEQPWKDKKERALLLSESYGRLNNKKQFRVRDCANYLEFRRYISDGSLKLNLANFCKVRLCPMCAWRRSMKIFGQVSTIMDYALKSNNYRYLFLTLTCKNVEGHELSDVMTKLFKAYEKMSRKTRFKKSVPGWFRALEITYNFKDGTYHPHFHCILQVDSDYFNKRSKLYLSQAEWTELWKDAMGIEYTPIVHVQAFDTVNVSKSVSETAKYTVKDADYIIFDENNHVDEDLTDNAVSILDEALKGRRLVAFGGELKKIHKELNLDDSDNGDLINTGDEELRPDLEYIIERYCWNIGYSNFTRIGE